MVEEFLKIATGRNNENFPEPEKKIILQEIRTLCKSIVLILSTLIK